MKKICFVFLIAFFVNFVFAKNGKMNFDYALPSFEFGSAYIIDVFQFAKTSNFSKIRIFNYANNEKISFIVYVHSPAKHSWQDLGRIELEGFGDELSVGRNYKNLGKHRYFAIQCADKQSSNSFAYQIAKSGASLRIFVRDVDDDLSKNPAPKYDAENAFTFSKLDLPDDAEENVVFKNATMDLVVSFRILGWNKKTYSWENIGATSCVAGNEAKIDLDDVDKEIDYWDFFAIVPGNDKKYTYSFSEAWEDLIVIVTDLAEK